MTEDDKDKILIGHGELILMEKAARLKVKTGFEKRLLRDRMDAVEQYSQKAVITKKQLQCIESMARRYDDVMRRDGEVIRLSRKRCG